MARPADRHLTQDELEALVPSRAMQRRDLSSPGDDPGDVSSHVAECEKCRLLAASYAAAEARLTSLKSGAFVSRRPDCPPEEEWLSLAVGLLAAERTEEDMQHAANCDHCGPLLRRATEDFANELTSDEEFVLDGLKSRGGDWQRGLATSLSNMTRSGPERTETVASRWKRLFRRPRLAFVAAVLAVAILAAWLGLSLLRPRSPDELIAQAYSEERTFELRFPHAGQAPIRQQRGSEGSPLSKPAALLEAELLIKRQLSKTPNDPRWLAAKGRSELLEWRYEDAIRSFERALETDPDSPDIFRDLATAHFQRAEVEHRPSDYGNAIQDLGQALATHPRDSVALFNRAIIYERMFLYDNAKRDWEAYLKLDRNGPWSSEARHHLDELRNKLQNHDQSQQIPIENPLAALTFLDKRLGLATSGDTQPNSLDEQYFDLANEKWLPALADDLQRGITVEQSSYGRALQVFSRVWELRHGDPWLADLLKSAGAPGFPDAAKTLAGAITASSKGNPSLSLQRAELAARQFNRLPNRAGVLRAELESVYALQRSLQDEKCLQSARVLGASLDAVSYSWIQARLLLERAACAASIAHIEDAEHFVEHSEQIAAQRQFEALYMRGLSFASDFAADRGDRDVAWNRAQLGLQRYWSGSFPAIRGYALCASLGYLAEDSEQGWTALAFWSEAVPLIQRTPNRSTEGLARYRLATEEIAVGRNAEANQELLRIRQIFTSLPKGAASLNYRVASEVSLAAVESALGERAAARTRLKEVGAYVQNVGQYQTALQYFRTLGDEQIVDGDWQAAEKSLQSAVAISQLGLTALTSDEDRLNWDRQMSDAYRSLIRLLVSQQGREQQALRIWEWYRSLPFQFGKVVHPSAETSLARLIASPTRPGELDVDSLLPSLDNVTFLTYAQLSDGIVFWAYDDRGVTFHRVRAPIEEVSAVSKKFVHLCSDPASDTVLLKADAQKLYEWLISPIQTLLSPAREIWIEPDGVLSFVPFQALSDPNGNTLLANVSVAYRSTAAGKRQVREPRVEATDRALVASSSLLGPPSSRTLPPLPDATREAEAVASRFPNHRLLLGEDNRPELVRAELRKADVFHYAGHFVPTRRQNGTLMKSIFEDRPERMLGPGIPPGFVLARCKLVVLSACSTGSNERLGLFDPNGLVHPLLRSGARRVIASRWNVDSSVTAQLMDHLYLGLLSGQTSVDALRSAARALASDPDHNHPYYWAAFAVFAQD